MWPTLNGVSGILPLAGSSAARRIFGAPAIAAAASPAPPTMTPRLFNSPRRSVIGVSSLKVPSLKSLLFPDAVPVKSGAERSTSQWGRTGGPGSTIGDPVRPDGGIVAELGALAGGIAAREALEGVPQHVVRERHLVDREIALEHRALWPELFDAIAQERRHPGRQLFRADRHLPRVPVKAEARHADPAELEVDIATLRDLRETLAPR